MSGNAFLQSLCQKYLYCILDSFVVELFDVFLCWFQGKGEICIFLLTPNSSYRVELHAQSADKTPIIVFDGQTDSRPVGQKKMFDQQLDH